MYKNTARIWPKRRFIASCQHFAVTISGAATSATATIDAVDQSKAFIVWGGVRSTATVINRLMATAVLTDAVTVTATRNSGTNTTVVRGTVVQATGYLVRSVQAGTITLSAATSNTATINAVDTARSIVLFNGHSSASTAAVLTTSQPGLALTNSTTVTASLASAGSGTVAFTVVEFQPAAVISVQPGTVDVTNTNTSDTVALAPDVQPELAAFGYAGGVAGNSNPEVSRTRAALSGGSQVADTRTTGTSARHGVWGAVIHFAAGVIRGVQRGTIALASATSGTAAIAPVEPARTWLGFLGNDAAVGATIDQSFATAALTDATTVTAELSTAGTATVSYEAVSFN